eukprot:1669017-Amphidinium_carterae.2
MGLMEQVEVLTESRVHWQRGSLLESSEFLASSLERLSTCLLACWRFTDWTSNRWATIRASARNVGVAFMLGYMDMFAFMYSHKVIGEYEANSLGISV